MLFMRVVEKACDNNIFASLKGSWSVSLVAVGKEHSR